MNEHRMLIWYNFDHLAFPGSNQKLLDAYVYIMMLYCLSGCKITRK